MLREEATPLAAQTMWKLRAVTIFGRAIDMKDKLNVNINLKKTQQNTESKSLRVESAAKQHVFTF